MSVNSQVPTECPECGGEFSDFDLLPQDDQFDTEAAKEVGATFPDERFMFIHVCAECADCGVWTAYGPRWYFNPASGNYDLAAPPGLEPEPPINNPEMYDRPLL